MINDKIFRLENGGRATNALDLLQIEGNYYGIFAALFENIQAPYVIVDGFNVTDNGSDYDISEATIYSNGVLAKMPALTAVPQNFKLVLQQTPVTFKNNADGVSIATETEVIWVRNDTTGTIEVDVLDPIHYYMFTQPAYRAYYDSVGALREFGWEKDRWDFEDGGFGWMARYDGSWETAGQLIVLQGKYIANSSFFNTSSAYGTPGPSGFSVKPQFLEVGGTPYYIAGTTASGGVLIKAPFYVEIWRTPNF